MADVVKGNVSTPAIKDAYYRKLKLESEIENEEDMLVSDQIQERILAATTAEEIFAAQNAGTIAGKDFLNRPFRLRKDGIRVLESTVEPSKDNPNPEPFYVLLNVTELADGSDATVNCGGKTLVTAVISLRDNGILDEFESQGGMPLMITAKATRGGDSVLMLSPFAAAIQNGKAKK